MRIQKMMPVLALAAIALLLLSLYLPGFLRYRSFRADLGRFINLIKKGDPVAAAAYVDDVDYDSLVQIIDAYVPQDYFKDLAALNVSSVEWNGKEYAAKLVVRFTGNSYNGVGQLRLRWHRTPKGWRFALKTAEVAEGYPEGDFTSVQSFLNNSDLFHSGNQNSFSGP
jgi:hypothetical protein